MLQYFRSVLFLKIDFSLKQFIDEEMLPDEYECIAANLANFSESDLSRGLDTIITNIQSFKKVPIPQLPLELTVVELVNRGKNA